jgi:hypothetical protein
VLESVLPERPVENKFPFTTQLHNNIIGLFRVMGEFMVLLQFTTHTDVSLESMEVTLKKMSVLEKVNIC